MVEQERLSRKRHAFGESPREAVAACLAEAGIEIGAVAEVAVGWEVPRLVEIESGDFDEQEFLSWLLGSQAAAANATPPMRFVPHHIAHAASAFYTSGFAQAAILVVDGRGEDVATTIAIGGPDGIEVIRSWGTSQSIGHLYGWAAEWAGLTMWGTGKLMGLAAYGKPCQPVPLDALSDGYEITGAPSAEASPLHHFVQLRSRLRAAFERSNYPFCEGQPADVMAHADFAASIQGALEEAILSLARVAREQSGCSQLVFAGGVALNCSANGALIRAGIFDEVWIPPVPHDAGVSLGAALVADRACRGRSATSPPLLSHAFWAPSSGAPTAETLAQLSCCEVHRFGDAELAQVVAQYLAAGRIVGWFQGRAEVGQRALGARSILCDPRRRHALLRANLVKRREPWRPLAPAVLAECAGSIFTGPLPAATDFMLAAWPVRVQSQPLLAAAVHVDGTARPQVVYPRQARLHSVIRAFHEITGVPAVINTSFNLAGEPIVLSPHDAVGAFLRSDLDVLVLDELVAVKRSPELSKPRVVPSPAETLSFMPWVDTRP
jgi:carbamoyltransferase